MICDVDTSESICSWNGLDCFCSKNDVINDNFLFTQNQFITGGGCFVELPTIIQSLISELGITFLFPFVIISYYLHPHTKPSKLNHRIKILLLQIMQFHQLLHHIFKIVLRISCIRPWLLPNNWTGNSGNHVKASKSFQFAYGRMTHLVNSFHQEMKMTKNAFNYVMSFHARAEHRRRLVSLYECTNRYKFHETPETGARYALPMVRFSL